jgi:hypothetical protein
MYLSKMGPKFQASFFGFTAFKYLFKTFPALFFCRSIQDLTFYAIHEF